MNIKFDEKGLIPAVVQDATSKEVLTVAYMNEESLQKTIETKETWFYSRSRQELWHKGATSGNTQKVVDIRFDCDRDALVVLVVPAGPACHRGSYSCFSDSLLQEEIANADNRYEILNLLEATIAQREAERPEGSYTTYLFEKGIDKMLKKIGEEAGEVIIAAKNRDPEELRWEIADLLFHLLVVMREQNLSLDEVLDTLKERQAK